MADGALTATSLPDKTGHRPVECRRALSHTGFKSIFAADEAHLGIVHLDPLDEKTQIRLSRGHIGAKQLLAFRRRMPRSLQARSDVWSKPLDESLEALRNRKRMLIPLAQKRAKSPERP